MLDPVILTALGLLLTLVGSLVAGIWGATYPGTLIVASGHSDFARKQRRMAWALRGGLLLVTLGTLLQLVGALRIFAIS